MGSRIDDARKRSAQPSLAGLGASCLIVLLACASAPTRDGEDEGGTQLERVTDAYATYARGDCEAVRSRFAVDRVGQWPPGEAREKALSGSTPRSAIRRDPVSYPPIAHRAGISGHAVVEFEISEDGTTDAIIVVDSSPALLFDGAAIRAIRSWRYATDAKSAKIDRQAIRLVFRPEDGQPAPDPEPAERVSESAERAAAVQ